MKVSRILPLAIVGATALAVTGTAGIASRTSLATAHLPTLTVYKNEGCLCCDKWAEYFRQLGFEVDVQAVPDLPQRFAKHGVAPDHQSCHLAEIGPYVVVGHVPPAEVVKLLKEKPSVAGIAVPGMPAGSYGMEVPGRAGDTYDVVTLDRDGGATPVARYRGPSKLE